jgi:hypothetical protein
VYFRSVVAGFQETVLQAIRRHLWLLGGFAFTLMSMRNLITAVWSLAAVGALCGAYVIVHASLRAQTTSEQGDCAAVAIACALIPYCLARAASEIVGRG